MKKIISIDTGLLRKENLLNEVLRLSSSTGNFTTLVTDVSMIEWAGFNWVQFLNNHDISSCVEQTWNDLFRVNIDLDLCDGLPVLEAYYQIWLNDQYREKLLAEFSLRLDKQLSVTNSRIIREMVEKACERLLFSHEALKQELLDRLLTLFIIQALLAPETVDIPLRFNEQQRKRRKIWMQHFLLQFALERFRNIPRSSGHLWPLYLSITNNRLQKRQAVDVEFYDMLLFGTNIAGTQTAVDIYTAETAERLRERLKIVIRLLQGVGGDIQRNEYYRVMQPPVIFGKVFCLKNDLSYQSIDVGTLFLEAAEELLSETNKNKLQSAVAAS